MYRSQPLNCPYRRKYFSGCLFRLAFRSGDNLYTSDLLEQTRDATDSIQKDSSTTHKILVKNFPPAVDKVMLEAFFEARKTGGGGPVKNVQLNREKNWAVVEFDGSDGMHFFLYEIMQSEPSMSWLNK